MVHRSEEGKIFASEKELKASAVSSGNYCFLMNLSSEIISNDAICFNEKIFANRLRSVMFNISLLFFISLVLLRNKTKKLLDNVGLFLVQHFKAKISPFSSTWHFHGIPMEFENLFRRN